MVARVRAAGDRALYAIHWCSLKLPVAEIPSHDGLATSARPAAAGHAPPIHPAWEEVRSPAGDRLIVSAPAMPTTRPAFSHHMVTAVDEGLS